MASCWRLIIELMIVSSLFSFFTFEDYLLELEIMPKRTNMVRLTMPTPLLSASCNQGL